MKFAGWALLAGAWLVYGLEVGDALAALLLLFGFGVIARAYAAERRRGIRIGNREAVPSSLIALAAMLPVALFDDQAIRTVLVMLVFGCWILWLRVLVRRKTRKTGEASSSAR